MTSPVPSPPSRRPLKILQVASHFPNWGGTEIHVLQLTEQLLARGHDVTISCRPGFFVEAEAQKRGLPIFHATVRKQQDWHDAKPYGRFIKAGNFDVVHAHWRADYLVAPTLAKLAKVPVVLMSHHSPYPLQLKEVLIFPRFVFNRMIGLSESVRQMLIRCGVPSQKTVAIHHGTDVSAFRQITLAPDTVRADWNIPAGRFVVGIAGRVSPEKGIADVMRAIAARPELSAHLVIIGTGKQDDDIHALCDSLHLAGRVTFAGFRADIANAINALDALVLASTWAEPCAAVVQQAMALEKPVVGTNIGGTPEMIADGETGIVVPPGDVAAIGAALEKLHTIGDAGRAALGRAGRARVEAHFSLSGMVDKIESLYYAELACARGGE